MRKQGVFPSHRHTKRPKRYIYDIFYIYLWQKSVTEMKNSVTEINGGVTENLKPDYGFYLKVKPFENFQINSLKASQKEFNILCEFINLSMLPGKNYDKSTSYYWKHIFEKLLGFYISNEILVYAFWFLNYDIKPDDKKGRNWNIKLDSSHAKKLRYLIEGKQDDDRTVKDENINAIKQSFDNLKEMIYIKYGYERAK